MLGSHYHKSGYHKQSDPEGRGLLFLLLGVLLLAARLAATTETADPPPITMKSYFVIMFSSFRFRYGDYHIPR